jgi:hypothetical protein
MKNLSFWTIVLILINIFYIVPVDANNSRRLTFNPTATPADFAGSSRPRYRTSGGSRGTCANQLVALVPGSGGVNLQNECAFQSVTLPALTLDDTPTLWFYIPQLSSADVPAEWVLLDENQQPLQTERIVLSSSPGIISFTLTQPLEADRAYTWVFSILANPQSPSLNPKVEGMIQYRIANARLQAQLQNLSQLEKIKIYANQSLWHDALTLLAEQRLTAPDDATLTTHWTDFLNSVGLGAIAEAPLQNCCVSRK